MSSPQRTPWSRWAYAAKPASWPKLLVPTLLGQSIGVAGRGSVDLAAAVVGFAFTVALLLFIVFFNDYFDREVDTIKREMFPTRSSPKTIPDGILPASALRNAGVLAGALALGLAWVAATSLGRNGATWFGAGCLGLFLAYSAPPLRLNYRGGGEWLEMLGVGLALPLFQAFLQAGEVPSFAWGVLPGFVALSLASAIASGLADERSDVRGGKRTFATQAGNSAARARVESIVLVGAVAWAVGARFVSDVLPPLAAFAALTVVIVNFKRLRRHSPGAQTDAFEAQGRYKRVLHHAIWRGGICVAMGLLWGALR